MAEASGGSGGLYLTNNQSEPVLLSAAADTLPLTASIGDLGPTLYQVWVVDSLNCTSDTVFVTVDEPAPLVDCGRRDQPVLRLGLTELWT